MEDDQGKLAGEGMRGQLRRKSGCDTSERIV